MPTPTPVPHDPPDSESTERHAGTSTSAAGGVPTGSARRSGTSAPRALVVPMHRILRRGGIAAAIGLPLAALIGYLVAGVPGAWGGLLGMGIALVFLAVTVVVALATARTQASTLGLAVLVSWLVKIIVLIVVLALLRGKDFYSAPVLFVSLLVGIAGSLFIEWRVVSTTQVPYIETDPR